MTNKVNEQFAEVTHKGVNATYDVIQASLDSLEKIIKLNIETSKKILEESSRAVKDMATASSPKELFDKVSSLATHNAEVNACHYHEAFEVVTKVQTQIGKTIEEHMRDAQQQIAKSVESFGKFNPLKSSITNDTFSSWVNGANQAFTAAAKVARQISEFTHKNMSTDATADSAKRTTGSKK